MDWKYTGKCAWRFPDYSTVSQANECRSTGLIDRHLNTRQLFYDNYLNMQCYVYLGFCCFSLMILIIFILPFQGIAWHR